MSNITAVVWGIGLAYGFAIAGLLYLLKQAFGEPLYEAVLEWWERRLPPDPIEERLARPQTVTRGETYVISDLHIDTWDRVPPIDNRPRERHFADFLAAAKKTALELYINGDILDMPPLPEEQWADPARRAIIPKYAGVFAELMNFNSSDEQTRTMTMYMAGNHDMAASGLRYLLHHNWDLLPPAARLPFQNVWYGHYIISVPYSVDSPRAQYRFFVEHGHYYDPVLLLYLLQFVIGAISSNLKAAMDSLTVGGQRRLSPGASIPRPGIARGRPTGEQAGLGDRIIRLQWRWKARRQLGRVNRQVVRAGERPLDGILMGHTHRPDYLVYRLGGVRGKVYANTGDWSGDTGNATYAVITEDGLIYLYDWHANPAPHHRRRDEQATGAQSGGRR